VAESALDSIATALLAGERIEIVTEVRRLILNSCAGQYQEIALRGKPSEIAALSSDYVLELTMRKAGSLGEIWAVIGAGLAGKWDTPLLEELRGCYADYLAYRQVIDDVADAASSLDKASDVARGIPTLPCVFYLKRILADLGADTEAGGSSDEHRLNTSVLAPGEEELRLTGATLFAEVVAETLRNRALAVASKIQEQWGGAEALLTLIGERPGEDSGRKSGPAPA
jgi:geranylgeranyl pyrophosphate synthase